MNTANRQHRSSLSQRKWFSPLPALVGLALLQVTNNGGLPVAVAQPPEPGANNTAYLIPEIDSEWQRLRTEMGLKEFTAPREVITRYQQFYEQKGVRSAATSVKITGVIAQIYWQQLGDRNKALQIYNWALEKYAEFPIADNLRRERDLIVNAPSQNDIVSIAPIVIAGQNEGKAVATATVSLNSPPAGAWPSVAPVTVGTVSPAGTRASVGQVQVVSQPAKNTTLASIILGEAQPNKPSLSSPVTITASMGQEGRGFTPVLPPAIATPYSNEWLPEVVLSFPAPSDNPLASVAVSVNSALRSIDAQIASVQVSNTNSVSQEVVSTLSTVNPRLAALNGYLAQWRSGRMSWEQLVSDSQFQATDITLLTMQPGLVSLYSDDAVLREKLGETMRGFPELVKDWAKLPPSAQIILADDYLRQKNPLAKTIYESLIQMEKLPDSVWWNKERLTYRVGLFHAAIGDYVKAAESNLKIAAFTSSPAWLNDSLIVAARYYRQAGQEEKAGELYKRAENGGHGWATGVARYDQARILIAQGKHEEAQRLLSQPITGNMSDQIRIALWALLGTSYYQTGDEAQARKYSEDAIDQSKRVTRLYVNEGMGDIVAMAQRTLQYLDQWQNAPLLAQPASVSVVFPTDHPTGEAFRFPLGVQSRNRVPLMAKSDNPSVKVSAVPPERAADHGHYFETMVVVEISAETLTQLRKDTGKVQFQMEVKSSTYPDVVLNIPVVVMTSQAE